MQPFLEIAFCMGFLYWAFPSIFSEGYSRFNKMVDVLTTRMFETVNRFSPRENNQTDSLASIASLKRFSRDQKYRRTMSRDADLKARDSQLFDIKENTPEVIIPKRRPFTGLSCENCTLNSRESLVNKTTERLALKNILDFTPQVQDGYLHRTFPHLFQVYKLKKFDYPQVAEIVLKDERLQLAVEKTAIEQFEDLESDDDVLYQQLLKKNQKRAEKLLYAMRSTLSDFLLRFTSWVLYKLLPCFMSSVVAQLGHIEMLKEASKSNLPLIFLPLHKSHLDYILCTFILLNNNIRSPLVAAGDNLKIPFFGYLLRGLGAFFIKRRIDPVKGRTDHVYKAVLHTYLNECLRAGHNVEFFLEGGRTRTGKPCMPKYGVLSVIVEAFMDGTIEDALLVPVSVNYEKLVDGNFIREQLGQPKEMETFGSAIKGIWHVLNSDYGMMRIDFNQPFSLKELVNTFHRSGNSPVNGSNTKVLMSNPSTSSLFGTDVVSDDNKGVVERISKHIIYDCSQSTSVMCTNALAFLLLHKFRNGATVAQLSVALDELRKCLLYARKDIGFSGESFNVINYAADMLGPTLVKKEQHGSEIFIKPFATLPNAIELSYYSNTLVTHFALESIVAMALNKLGEHSNKFNLQDLVDSVLELCDIFQYEFLLCKPCQDLDQAITNCIQELSDREQICKKEETNDYLSQKSRNVARQFDDDDEDEPFYNVVYEISQDEDCRAYVKFLSGITMSLIESYSMTAYVLHKLVGNTLLEVDLLGSIMEEMKIQLAAGTLHYEEAVSVDPMKNALKLYQKWGIVECYTQDRLRLYYLKENSNNNESVQQLYQRIQKYRSV